jgi:cyclic-di-GMP-binding protein
MPSFDITSEPDMHEVKNATDQVEREISQRYDFRGTEATIKTTDEGFELSATSQDRVNAILDVLRDKFVKRKISLKYLDAKEVAKAGGSIFKQSITLKKGIDKDNAKALVKLIKDEALKVTTSIQGEAVRVTGKKRDELQEAIAILKTKTFPLELNFGNFRD